MPTPNVHIDIIVYRGDPLDYQQFRHTAFWIRFSDGSPAILVHIIGTARMFEFQIMEAPNPTASSSFAKKIEVGFLTAPATPAQVQDALRKVPINNRDMEFNCQSWIESAMKTLVGCGHLTESAYQAGLDGMVDAIAEAEDED